MPVNSYVDENGSAAMLAAKRLAVVALDVNFREYVICMPQPSMNKAAQSGFEPREDISRSPK